MDTFDHLVEADLKQAAEMNLKGAIVERLTLSREKIEGVAEGLREIAQLDDPIGEIEEMKFFSRADLPKNLPIGINKRINEFFKGETHGFRW